MQNARALFPLLLTLLCACAQELDQGAILAPGRFHFPTGVTITPEGADLPQRLLVVSANTDLRYRSGRVHAFDLEGIDGLVDAALADCVEDCEVPRIFDLSPALIGAVEIGNLAGQIAAEELRAPGLPPVRAFIPVRGTATVVAVDLDDEGIRCSRSDRSCTDEGVIFPREDPFAVATGLGTVFVGNGSLIRESTGIIGLASASSPIWAEGRGSLTPIDVGQTAIGGLAVGDCRVSKMGNETCSLFANGRPNLEGLQRVFALDFREDALVVSPLFSRNVSSSQDGFDSRGLAVSTDGDRLFLANRFPDALAVVDVTRMPDLPSDSCVIPSNVLIEDGLACPDLPPSQRDRPAFGTVDLVPSPRRPLAVAVIPRELPDGSASDLVVMTTERSVAFFDGATGSLVANLEGVGAGPSDLAIQRRGEGARIFVPSFQRGTIAVIDLEDAFRPQEARVVALLGRPQEKTS